MPQPSRIERDLKLTKGRIIRLEQFVERLEQRIEDLETENQALKQPNASRGPEPTARVTGSLKLPQIEDRLGKLAAKAEQNRKDIKQNAGSIASLDALREPVRALVRSFKQTPGAPFSAWTTWMLSTFRKQGVYRMKIFK